jgi:hypothetical protein
MILIEIDKQGEIKGWFLSHLNFDIYITYPSDINIGMRIERCEVN